MVGANDVATPVLMSYARMFDLGMRFVPAAAPAGRALEKLPPAYTVLPLMTCAQTTPESICTVGSGSAVTVDALRSSIGAGPAEAAVAADPPSATTPMASRAEVVTMAISRRKCEV